MSAPSDMAMSIPPFLQKHELNQDLKLVKGPNGKVSLSTRGSEGEPHLPGYPRVQLSNDNLQFLNKELSTPELDVLAPHLWLVATQRSDHISALHHQLVLGRNIIITENPKLHLVWIDNRVYIKPIPTYLLSHAFWTYTFSAQNSLCSKEVVDRLSRTAAGFLRTYTHLIQYESDFQLAKEHSLISSLTTWTAWNAFISPFSDILDTEVSPRYHFGELRLSRLNFWSKFFLGRMNYFQVTGQTDHYLARVFAPLVFIWATCNVILAAMQVVMSVQALYSYEDQGRWSAFTYISRWFSVAVLLVVALAVLSFLLLIFGRFVKQLVFALRDLSKKQDKSVADDEKAGGANKRPSVNPISQGELRVL